MPWIAKHVLRLPQEITSFGNGDGAFANLRLLLQALFAAIGALVWTRLDTNAREYGRLYYWLRVVVRYTLAESLLTYGLAKVFHVQFPYPELTTLIRPFGELEKPARLLWAFMGFSRPYQIFAGAAECGAAVLLLWNRTTTLGALLACGALVNVLAMDWGYGVAVKMIACRMLLCAGFLLAKDAPRLARVLLWNLPTLPAAESVPWRAWRWKWAVQTLKFGIVAFILGSHIQWAAVRHPIQAAPGRPPLFGIYRVERHSLRGLDLGLDDSTRWSLVAFDNRTRNLSLMSIRRADESWGERIVEYDEEGKVITVRRDRPAEGRDGGTLQISRSSAETVDLKGSFDGDPMSVRLRRLPDRKFPLEKDADPRWIFSW